MLKEFVASGRVVDFVIAFMALEALTLFVYHRRTSSGPAPFDILSMLAAGLCLLLALRIALTGANWPWILALLAASLAAHLFDLRRRGWI